MAGVSDTGADGSADMQVIMNGGANWMARMTAFLQAKEDAQTIVDKAGIVGDINAIREEAKASRVAAAQELSDAKTTAADVVSAAHVQADALMAKAKADADKVMSDAKTMLEDATAKAGAALEDAERRAAEAGSAMALVAKRRADLDVIGQNLSDREAALTAAQAEAEAAKARYEALIEKLKGLLAELAGE